MKTFFDDENRTETMSWVCIELWEAEAVAQPAVLFSTVDGDLLPGVTDLDTHTKYESLDDVPQGYRRTSATLLTDEEAVIEVRAGQTAKKLRNGRFIPPAVRLHFPAGVKRTDARLMLQKLMASLDPAFDMAEQRWQEFMDGYDPRAHEHQLMPGYLCSDCEAFFFR